MKITRRSFVKKSSYTAAAVTVLGAGVALGEESDPQGLISEEVRVPTEVEFGSEEEWADEQDALNAGMNDLRNLLGPNEKRNKVEGSIKNKEKTYEIEMSESPSHQCVTTEKQPNGKYKYVVGVPGGNLFWKITYWK